MSNAKRFAKNSVALSISSLSIIAIGAIYRIFIAKYLGPTDYGRYVFIITFVNYVSPLALLGLRSVIIREVAKSPGLYKSVLRESTIIRGFTTFLSILIACTILIFLKKGPVVYVGVFLQAFALFGITALDTVESMIIARESSKYIAISAIISNLIKISIGLGLLMMGYRLLVVIGVYTATSFLQAGLSWYFCHLAYKGVKPSTDVQFTPNLRRFMISESLPFFYIKIISRVYYKNDVLILSILKGDRVTGLYGVAYLPVDALLAVANSISSAGLPIMSRLYAENKQRLQVFHNKMCKYMIVIFLTTSVVLTAVGPEILIAIFGERYAAAAPMIRLLVWMLPGEALTLGLSKRLTVSYQQRLIVKLTIVNAIINIALCFGLIWFFSYKGAAIATVVSANLTALIVLIAVHLRLHKMDWWMIWIKPMLCAGFGCLFAHYFVAMKHSLIGAIVGLLAYLAAVIVTKTLQASDYETIKTVFVRRSTEKAISEL